MSETAPVGPLRRPALLTRAHHLDSFDCGIPSLNDFLRLFALQNQKGGKSRTFVTTRESTVVAYYRLAPGSVAPADVPARVAMLLDALRRAVESAEVIGGRAVLVHAVDRHASGFHRTHDFEPSPLDENHLLMLIKDTRKTLGL